MEHEASGPGHRYVYSDKARLSVVVQGIENGSASLLDNKGELHAYYHCDYLGTTDYLTSAVNSKVISWTSYSEWGEITHNAVLKCGQRELDLVKEYATHDFDAVLNLYYAKARFYDADNRRFVAVDPILDPSQYDLREYVTDPMQLVQYLYVKDNAVIRIDFRGLTSISVTEVALEAPVPNSYILYTTSEKADHVIILSHSNQRSLILQDGSSTMALSVNGKNSAGGEIGNVSTLEKKTVKYMELLTCNAGHLDEYYSKGENLASVFSTRISGTVKAYDGNVSFGPKGIFSKINFKGNYEPRLARNQKGFHSIVKSNGAVDREPTGVVYYKEGKWVEVEYV